MPSHPIPLLAALLALASGTAAESPSDSAEPRNLVGLSIGIDDLRAKDEHASAEIHRGLEPAVSLVFQRRCPSGLLRLEANYGQGTSTTDFDKNRQKQKTASLSVGFAFPVAYGRPSGMPLVASATLGASWFLWDGLFREGEDLGESVIEAYVVRKSLDAGLLLEILPRPGHRISLEARAPVAMLLARPPYSSLDNRGPLTREGLVGGDLRWVFQDPQAETGIRYAWEASRNLSILAEHAFRFASARSPVPLGLFSNRISLGAGVRW